MTSIQTAQDVSSTFQSVDLLALPKTQLVPVYIVATALACTPRKLADDRSRKNPEIPFVKVGRQVRYRVADVLNYIESQTRGSATI